jgi:hypothetical protein
MPDETAFLTEEKFAPQFHHLLLRYIKPWMINGTSNNKKIAGKTNSDID